MASHRSLGQLFAPPIDISHSVEAREIGKKSIAVRPRFMSEWAVAAGTGRSTTTLKETICGVHDVLEMARSTDESVLRILCHRLTHRLRDELWFEATETTFGLQLARAARAGCKINMLVIGSDADDACSSMSVRAALAEFGAGTIPKLEVFFTGEGAIQEKKLIDEFPHMTSLVDLNAGSWFTHVEWDPQNHPKPDSSWKMDSPVKGTTYSSLIRDDPPSVFLAESFDKLYLQTERLIEQR